MKIVTLIVVALAAVSFSVILTGSETEEIAADPGEGWEKCGNNLWYKLDGTVLSFQGSGQMWNCGDDSLLPPKPGNSAPWYNKGITEVIWTYGNCSITKIGHSAFVGCESLTSMHWSNADKVEGEAVVPGSVTSVGKYGFYHNGFTKITFESGNKVTFDRYSMSGMPNLVEIVINKASSLPTIYPWADYCGKLTTLTINGNTNMDFQTFNGSNNLKILNIGPNVTSIKGLRTDQYALAIETYTVAAGNNTYILDDGVLLQKNGANYTVVAAPMSKQYYYMRDDVTTIGYGAFARSQITLIHFSENLTTIDKSAFRWCSNLQSVLLPDSCADIGLSAFIGCTAMKTIHFGTGLKTLWAETFEYANINEFDNNGKEVKINYDGSWVDHQLTDKEVGYLKNMTFTKDGKTMEDTGNRYAIVGFFTNNGTDGISSISMVKKGSKLSEPAEPTWENHAFDGWYRDSDSWARQWLFSNDVIQSDLKVYGMWTYDYEVSGKYLARSWNGVQRGLNLSAASVIELQRDIYSYGKSALILDDHRYMSKEVTIDLNGFTIDRQLSTADADGYVIRIDYGRQLTIMDSSNGNGTITGGYATNGGAIYLEYSYPNSTKLVIESGAITGNRASSGGAIYSDGGTITINGGSVSGNTATYGGAIYSDGGTITINGGSITGNSANNDGGALYIGNGTVTINDGSINGNSALTRCGGAIYINSAQSTLNLYGGTVTGNIAAADGGAILYGAGTVNVQGSPVVQGNVAPNGMDVMLRSNMFLTVTGAMGVDAMISLAAADSSQILAKPSGAAIDKSYFRYLNAELVIENGNLKVNLADRPADFTWVSNYKQLQAAIDNNAQKIGLMADILGGFDDRLKVGNGKTVTLDLYGHVLDRKKGSIHSDGHVIQVMTGGDLTIRDSIGTGKITGGWANNGGGINVSDGGVCTLESGTITGNKAENGGGVCVKGTFIATGGFIINNSAEDKGGAINVTNTGTINLSNIVIANNTCDDDGGALNVNVKDGNSWIRDSYIIGNKAKDDGGGIYYNQSGKTLTVERTVIAGNSSNSEGGGVYNNNGTLVLNDCDIYNNTAKGDGGGIYNNDTPVNITGGTISNNTCNKSGGAIRAYDGTTTITGVTFTGNVAKENGGAIYLNNGGTVNINGCVMEGNTATDRGGAMIVNDSSGNKLSIQGTVVMYGNKGGNGDDLYLASGKKITISGALGEGTKIGVALKDTTGTFTSGYGTYHGDKDPAAFFVVSYGYATYVNNGEAAIAKMSSSAYFDISVARTDGRTSQLTVRVKLIKNGQDSQYKDVVIMNAPVSTSFEIASAGSAVYTVVSEAIEGTDKDVYRCLVTGGDGNYTVTCKDVVAETEGFIDAIGEVEYTDACKARIDAARAAYNDLTAAQKQLVDDSGKTAVLTTAEATYANLKADHEEADATIVLIDAIGEVEHTDACKARIDAARASYDALTVAQKQLVDVSGKTAVLTTAEDEYPALGVVSLIDAIGPYNPQEREEYKTRVATARSAYDLLTAAQKALVTNYDDLIEAEKNVEEGTAVDLTQVVVSFDGWEYGQYSAHSPTVNIDNVPEGEMKNHLASVIEQSKLEYTYLDSSGKGVVLSNSLPAGDYTAKIIFPKGDGYKSGSKTTAFTVTQAQLTDIIVNWTDTAEWTGSVKTVDATAGPLSVGYGMDVEIRDNGGDITDPLMPGVYTIKLTITNGNYVFNIGGVSSEYSTTLTIIKAANSITSLSMEGWTYGNEASTPTATATYGAPTFTYSPSLDGEYVQSVPTSSGSYYIKATVAATDVYNGAEATSQFSISKANLTITADNTAVWKGNPAPEYTFKITGLIGEDTWADYYNGSPTVTCTYDPASSTESQYPITISLANVSLKDQSKDDYILIPVNGVLNVQDAQGRTVTFDLNYNNPPEEDVPEPITVHKNQYYGTLPSATRAGYSFVGWFTAASGGTQVTSSTVVTVEKDHTLYAHWTVGTYTVSFDANKPQNASSLVTGDTADQQFTYDAAAKALTANGYALTGWTFAGWNTAADGSGTGYTNQQQVSNLTGVVGGTVVLYAQWTANDYTVTFDNNGGTGGQASKIATYDSAYGDLPEPTKNGYAITGWFTAAVGGTQVTASTIMTVQGNHTLYAHWTSVVTLDLNGGDSGAASIVAEYNVSVFDAIDIPEKANYTFVGYYTAAVGGLQIIAPPVEPADTMGGFVHSAVDGYIDADGKWVATEAKTLYAHWICDVTLVYGEGEQDWVNIIATYNSSSFNAIQIPAKQGTEFLGYFNEAGSKIIDKPAEGTTISGFVTGAPVGGFIDENGMWVADGPKTLYVHWDNYYTVVFDYNGGEGAVAIKTVNGNPATYGELPTGTMLGHTLAGWFTEPDGGDEVESTTAVTSNHAVYAHWDPIQCTVSFDYRGMPGTTGETPDSIIVDYGQPYGNLPHPTKEGYILTWYISTGTPVTNQTIVTSDHTLYAVWTSVVTLDANGGEGGSASFVASYKSDSFIAITAPEKEGNIFTGYYTEAGNEGSIVISPDSLNSYVVATVDGYLDASGNWIATEAKTLYAHWAESWTVTFDPNGGSSATFITKKVAKGSTYGDFPGTSRAGYTLAGWFTGATEGDEVTSLTVVDADRTVYAHWTANTYSVEFNPNGGTGGPMANEQFTYDDEAKPLTANTYIRTGYEFYGWNTAADGSGVSFTDEQSVRNLTATANSTVILYAQWAACSYTVTFDPNSGSVPLDSKGVLFGSPYGDLPTPSKSGYDFDGWFTAPEGGDLVTADTQVSIDDDHTLYAHWSLPVVVSFNPNGGSVSPDTKTVIYDRAYGDLPTPSKSGYDFDGWFTAPEGGDLVTADTQVSIDDDHTLYAHWTANTYIVVFNASGGSVSPDTKTVVYNSAYGSLPVPHWSGYDFEGWFTEASGGTRVTSSTIVSTAFDHTLYAQWSIPEVTVTVTFDSMGGSPAGSKTVTVDSSYGSLPDTYREGYDFEGWYTEAFGGTLITSRSTVAIDSDHTLYAHWVEHEHIVNPDGSVTDVYTETVENPDGSVQTQVSETTVWPDGSSVVKQSELYEKENPDGSSVTELKETVIETDASGDVVTTEISVESEKASSGVSKTTENVRIETDEAVTTQTKVTDVTADGKVTVRDTIRSEVEEYMIVSTAKSETTSEGTTAVAVTAIQSDDGVIDADTAAAAVSNLAYVTAMLGATDVDAAMMIDATDLESVTLTGGALDEFAETDLGLRFIFDDGTLHYDADATRTLSRHDEVDISLSKDDESILTDAQKAAVGKASFVSVTAQAGQTYIKDLDGTVSITYIFGNPEGWKDFAAYHIAEDGTKTLKESSYDEGTGQMTIYSTHHSIYAVLESSGFEIGSIVWIAVGIIAVLAIAIAFYVVRSKKV